LILWTSKRSSAFLPILSMRSGSLINRFLPRAKYFCVGQATGRRSVVFIVSGQYGIFPSGFPQTPGGCALPLPRPDGSKSSTKAFPPPLLHKIPPPPSFFASPPWPAVPVGSLCKGIAKWAWDGRKKTPTGHRPCSPSGPQFWVGPAPALPQLLFSLTLPLVSASVSARCTCWKSSAMPSATVQPAQPAPMMSARRQSASWVKTTR
jgi:hypothetical protein